MHGYVWISISGLIGISLTRTRCMKHGIGDRRPDADRAELAHSLASIGTTFASKASTNDTSSSGTSAFTGTSARAALIFGLFVRECMMHRRRRVAPLSLESERSRPPNRAPMGNVYFEVGG